MLDVGGAAVRYWYRGPELRGKRERTAPVGIAARNVALVEILPACAPALHHPLAQLRGRSARTWGIQPREGGLRVARRCGGLPDLPGAAGGGAIRRARTLIGRHGRDPGGCHLPIPGTGTRVRGPANLCLPSAWPRRRPGLRR